MLLEAVAAAVNTLLHECPDDALDHTVLLRAMWSAPSVRENGRMGDELLL
jgi:hypothetical protein